MIKRDLSSLNPNKTQVVNPPEVKQPTPQPQLSSESLISALAQAISRVNVQVAAPQVNIQSPNIEPIISNNESPRQWEFHIKRDTEGLIQSIIATAD